MLKTQIKASGITNLTDARYFAAREVTWLGFPLDDNPENPGPEVVKAMIEWVDGVIPVAEFSFSSPEDIIRTCTFTGIKTVQTGMFSTPDDLAKLAPLSVIREVVVETSTSKAELAGYLDSFAPFCELFILSFSGSGISWQDIKKGFPFDKSALKELSAAFRIILDIDCPADDLNDMIHTIRPAGLALRGGEEEKTGFKSFDELDELLDALEFINQIDK